MAACMMSLFEMQKDQRRLAACSATPSTVLRPAKPKKEDTCKQIKPLTQLNGVQNIIPQNLAPQKSSQQSFDVEFVVQLCSFVAPSETDNFLDALLNDKENIQPNSDLGVLCFNARNCPFCGSSVSRSPKGLSRVVCSCANVWCWRCVVPWDYCHLECSSIPNLTAEDIVAFINKPIKKKQPAQAGKKAPLKRQTHRTALQLLR